MNELVVLTKSHAKTVAIVRAGLAKMTAAIEALVPIDSKDKLADAKKAIDTCSGAVVILKTVRTAACAPSQKIVDAIRGELMPIEDAFKKLEDRTRGETAGYFKREKDAADKVAAEERERVEAARRAEDEARKAAAAAPPETRVEAHVALATAQAETRAAETAAEESGPTFGVRTDEGTLSAVFTWDFEIVDPAAVDRAFCLPSPKLIAAAVAKRKKEGAKLEDVVIAGVRIFEDAGVASRKASSAQPAGAGRERKR